MPDLDRASLDRSPGGSPVVIPADASPHNWWRKTWLVVKVVQARLRFIVILAAVGGTRIYWDTLKAHYERWTRPGPAGETASHSDTEYWCPMHPTVVRDHPDKCPICGMPLSQRKKGANPDEPLPAGVVSRVQLT